MSKEIDAIQFEQALRDNGIPPRPVILELISTELRKDDADFRVLEKGLMSDVAIAAGLVKTANSPLFGLRRRVGTVMEALEVLGLRVTAQVVAGVALRAAFPDARLIRFWDASAQIAGLSAWLVNINRWPGIRADEAYTFGLFRDCGIAVLLQRLPTYEQVLAEANTETGRGFTAVEESVLPVNHAAVGAMMTQSWWLPPEITEGVRHHHDLSAIAPVSPSGVIPVKSTFLIAVSQLAEYLFQETTGLCRTREWEKLGQACLKRLGLDESALAEMLAEAGEMLDEAVTA